MNNGRGGWTAARRGTALLWMALAAACGGSTPTSPTPTFTLVTPPSTTTQPSQPQPTDPPTPSPIAPSPRLTVSRILCFGDSLTAGFIAIGTSALRDAPVESYPTQLLLTLQQRYRDQTFTVANAGQVGEWAVDGQYRLVDEILAARPDVVVLMDGANDLNALGPRGVESALEALENMLRDARAREAKVVLASLPPQRPGGVYGGAALLIPQFNSGVQSLAGRQGVLFADVYRAFGGDLSLIGPDGLHPTAQGYLRIAQTVFDVLRTNLEQPSAQTPLLARPSP